MRTVTPTALVAAGLRGLACAGVATLLTALFCWRFVTAADAGDWMAGAAVGQDEPAT